MKAFIVGLCLLVVGCNSETQYGQCVGATEDKQPNLVYKVDTWNLVWGIVFIETIFVPLVVLLTRLECPVAKR